MVSSDAVKETALMVLANGVYSEVITEEQALNVMFAMDNSSTGEEKLLNARAKSLTPIFVSLTEGYLKGSGKS